MAFSGDKALNIVAEDIANATLGQIKGVEVDFSRELIIVSDTKALIIFHKIEFDCQRLT